MEKQRICILLGNNCIVHPELFVWPDTKVITVEKIAGYKPGAVLEAKELSGFSNMIFQPGENGEIQVRNNYV